LLQEARQELRDLQQRLGGEESSSESIDKVDRTVAELYADMDGVARLSDALPNVFPLNKRYLKESGLDVPKDFEVLTGQADFFWLEIPVGVVNGEKTNFDKIQLGLAFNPGEKEPRLLPKAHSMFPDKTFAKGLAIEGGIKFGLGSDLKFNVAGGVDKISLPETIPLVNASAEGKLGVNAELAPKLGLIAGPYSYTFKRAVIDASGQGTERIFWTLADRDMLREQSPKFVVILQVPKGVNQVKVTAALRAYPVLFLPQALVRLLSGLSPKIRDFLTKGGPTKDDYVYDISSRIQ
jgi:hypothetical protein